MGLEGIEPPASAVSVQRSARPELQPLGACQVFHEGPEPPCRDIHGHHALTGVCGTADQKHRSRPTEIDRPPCLCGAGATTHTRSSGLRGRRRSRTSRLSPGTQVATGLTPTRRHLPRTSAARHGDRSASPTPPKAGTEAVASIYGRGLHVQLATRVFTPRASNRDTPTPLRPRSGSGG